MRKLKYVNYYEKLHEIKEYYKFYIPIFYLNINLSV